MKTAIITGITGQDGAYLADLLLNKNYIVYGTYRVTNHLNFWRIKDLGIDKHQNLHLVEDNLIDLNSILRLFEKIMPDEVYNLAAQSFVDISFNQLEATAQITALAPLRLLEAIKIINPKIKFYQASSSEMFGNVKETPQNEDTNFFPRNPYGIGKLYAHLITVNYREMYDIFACCGILYNHESPLRGIEFVTRKITDAFAKIKLGIDEFVELGNLNAKRDWGFAKEYVYGIWLMMQQNKADTYILATGSTKSVKDFINLSAKAVDIDLVWKYDGVDTIGIDSKTNKVRVKVNKKFYRPDENVLLMGDPTKAKNKLKWTHKTNLDELCCLMIKKDIERNRL